jgi:hypothetical protein
MDTVTIALIGTAFVVIIATALFRPKWLKYALIVAGVFAGAGLAHSYMARVRRLRELGLNQAEAERISTIIGAAKEIKANAQMVNDLAKTDADLKAKQTELETELQRISKEGMNADAVRAEIRQHWPDF